MKKLNLEKLFNTIPDDASEVKFNLRKGLNINSYIHLDYGNQDVAKGLSTLATADVSLLKEELEHRGSIIDTLSSEAEEIVKKWRIQEKTRRLLEAAIKVAEIEKPEHTDNKWEITNVDGLTKHKISNTVYRMDIHICQRQKYSNSANMSLPQWVATWGIRVNGGSLVIHGQEKKSSDIEVIEKYIEKIKTQYAYYFTCENPPIPRKYENFFLVNGVLPPIYTLEPETVDMREAG